MWIEAVDEYLNLRPFGRLELPDLTVLIGPNGSGKSNLLKGIESGVIATEFTPHGTPHLQPRKTSGIILRIESGQTPSGVSGTQASQMGLLGPAAGRSAPTGLSATDYARNRERLLAPFVKELISHGYTHDDGDGFLLSAIAVASQISSRGRNIDMTAIEDIFRRAREALSNPPSSMRLPPDAVLFRVRVSETASVLGKDPLQVTLADIEERGAWGEFGMFAPNMSLLFAGYRDVRAANILERANPDSLSQESPGLSDSEFIATYGAPPWTQVSELLSAFGLPYSARVPAWALNTPVSFQLVRNNDGVVVAFEDLSSGERVLVRFAISLFQFDPLRIKLTIPKLLLLDEMDASLHPEMVHRWITAINSELVKARGIKCILTTHSPTTVAIVPEDALFEMADGLPGLKKVTRQQALNRLTFGLPALSVDFEGRRQIFVESGTDAEAYQQLADILKFDLDLPRTLTFMATGPKKGEQEQNTGCATVEHVVRTLSENGNRSVFGILDWDGHHVGDERIKVLGEGRYYAIENVLLNPLLIAVLLLRDTDKVPETDVNLRDLHSLTSLQAQSLADAIQNGLVAPSQTHRDMQSVRFLGGIEIEIHSELRTMNGHSLQKALCARFPSLLRHRSRLNAAVIHRVLKSWRELTPEPIIKIFKEIASQELA